MRLRPLFSLVTLLALVASTSACRSGASAGRIQLADGMEHLALGDTLRARTALERARWELPDEAAAWAALADLDLATGTIEGLVQARRSLLRAIDLAPEVADYRVTLGALLREQRYTRASNRMLAEAVRLDPSAGKAWRLLGLAMLEQYLDHPENPADLDSAVACYERALALDTGDVESRQTLAFVAIHLHDFQRARELLRPAVQADSCGRSALLLAAAEFRAGREASADSIVAGVIPCMSWEEREPYVGLQSVLHPDQASAWGLLTPAHRDSAARDFWWSRDPTPTTLRNERWLEHVTRVVEADWYFRVPLLGKPGWQTDRGEMYQRYGAPEFAHRVEQRSWEWVYGIGAEGTSFLFTDRYLNGDYVRLRRGAGFDYSRLELPESTPEATRLAFGRPRAWRYARHAFRGIAGRTALDVTFLLQRDRSWTSALVEVAAWRDPGDRVVHVERRIESVDLFRLPDGLALGRLRMQVPAGTHVLTIQAAALPADTPASSGSVLTHSLWLASGRDSVVVEGLHADVLALSDLVLAHEVERAPGGLFDVGGIKVVPRVDSRIDTDEMALYFEVYASSAAIAARRPLSLRYEVRSLPPRDFSFWDQFDAGKRAQADPDRRPAVDARFSFTPRQPVERRDLRIDVGHLDEGAYALTVQVEDAVSGESASRTVEFDLDRSTTVGSVGR